MSLDTSHRDRRLAARLEDPAFRAEYERSLRAISQVDSVMQALDELREAAGLSKADLARAISKNPASIRRLFSSEANPELKTIAAMAAALDAEIVIKPNRRRHGRRTPIAA
jgi:ribosome-binding protein aMBF1 (putative translation factor)